MLMSGSRNAMKTCILCFANSVSILCSTKHGAFAAQVLTVFVYLKHPLTSASLTVRVWSGKLQQSAPMPAGPCVLKMAQGRNYEFQPKKVQGGFAPTPKQSCDAEEAVAMNH